MGSTRRSFTEEYKDQAVAFVIEGNRSVADVARNIGVHEMTLGKWVKQTRDSQQEQIPPDAELTGFERLELIRLRAELKDEKATIAELQMQVESVSYTHLRAHETRHDLVCRLLLEKK